MAGNWRKLSVQFVSALALLVALYARVRLLAVPLERDEGEFAYMGQLLLKGIAPFSHAYSMKLPGVSAAYALFISLFGATPTGVHLGLLLVNLCCVVLVYLLARRLFDAEAAALSGASFALLSLSRSVYGAHAHATHFVILFALAGWLLILTALDRRSFPRAFAAGLSLGAAVAMKQHAVLLLAFGLGYLVAAAWSRLNERKLALALGGLCAAGALVPYLAIVAAMAQGGSLARFWFWTVTYPRQYVTEQGIADGIGNFARTFEGLLLLQLPFWLLAAGGALLLALRRLRSSDPLFVAGLALFSLLAVCPGWYFREHYFVLVLPAAALLAGAAARAAEGLLPRAFPLRPLVPALLLAVAASHTLFHEREYLFTLTPSQVSRYTFDENPFPESLQVAAYLKEHTSPGDRIAVLGSEPQIYFYSDRLSATGHIYMYGLMENQPLAERMQREMIGEIEAARPKYVVAVNVEKSWLRQAHSLDLVGPWRERYLAKGYEVAGVTDIVSSESTRYLWGEDAARYTPVSHAYLTIYKRRDAI